MARQGLDRQPYFRVAPQMNGTARPSSINIRSNIELLGLADLDTRHKHESESVWCQAHHAAFLVTSNHNNSKNHYNNCSGDKQSNSQTLISLTAIPHKEAHHQ